MYRIQYLYIPPLVRLIRSSWEKVCDDPIP